MDVHIADLPGIGVVSQTVVEDDIVREGGATRLAASIGMTSTPRRNQESPISFRPDLDIPNQYESMVGIILDPVRCVSVESALCQ